MFIIFHSWRHLTWRQLWHKLSGMKLHLCNTGQTKKRYYSLREASNMHVVWALSIAIELQLRSKLIVIGSVPHIAQISR